MLLFRILTLPITMFVFMAVTVAATKAPAAVEMMSIGLWFALPLFLAIAAVKRLAGR
ncbi:MULTISPECIES: hypothetical protein [unclassified Rhizobium]|uniref:hypothetical protein n=1 Tax=unclassified Rhizobium TaxID=2613769 RepID=UPI000AA671ED|nr:MULTISPECIES: hypothetical protein [unclassified Rhizobium]